MKMPELRFDEEGSCTLAKANDWKLVKSSGLFIVLQGYEGGEEAELAILATTFPGSGVEDQPIHGWLAIAREGTYHAEADLSEYDNDDDDVGDTLTRVVNGELLPKLAKHGKI